MNDRVAVAISGGIDSLFSARLLIEKGYRVTGIHFVTGYGSFCLSSHENPEISTERIITHGEVDSRTVSAMALISDQLGIPIHIVDLSNRFESSVVSYFVDEYLRGRTPNPCLLCNARIKFGELLTFAQRSGCDRMATGHYVKNVRDDHGRIHLLKGEDTSKDQAYFLAFLDQKQLGCALFPLGDQIKKDIRSQAKAMGLEPVSQGESQDVCFIKDDYKDFLAGRNGFVSEPGPIRHVNGDIIGQHQGLHSFTIGQRRGISCPGPHPYYVTGLDMAENTLVVGPKEALYQSRCTVENPSWINEPATFPVSLVTRIRYSHKGVLSTVTPMDDGTLSVDFREPVLSVTPGQGAVFYQGDEVLGGGWIS